MNTLARALVPIAHRAFCLPVARPIEDEPLLAFALDAIDGFLAAPVASRYLTAARALGELTRLRRRSTTLEKLARRSLDVELGRLDALLPTPGSDQPSAIEQLRALPPDPRAGRRIQALAALLEAHRALAVRVRAPEQHRARITLPEGAAEPARRRGVDRRSARVPRKRRA